ncbi:hypothetical protein [Mycolicibacterium llatzerense]|uniref:Uncharacterized protein n=1 Tax=Mycolicibacterium llatzerense TaxID=280871 RepID=A0A0D1LGA1_9MYCO|nr:hypothetical protein [Mycolicibacterium llatzerense]KIU15021.1 hypothetical protein TL10_21125 [Mycolicibacterium llatzerense]
MEAATLAWTIAAAVLAGLSLIAAIVIGVRAERIAKKNTILATERSIVKWQVERKTPDTPGVFRVMNVGRDVAYEVTVEAWDSHDYATETVGSLLPYTLNGTVEYAEITLAHRSSIGPDMDAAREGVPIPIAVPRPFAGAPSFIGDLIAASDSSYEDMVNTNVRMQVQVEVSWRSKGGRWSTESIQTG